jgi:hypothetical protein
MKKLLAVLILGTSGYAMADGEILALQTTGTEYCPGFTPIRFTPSTDVPLFVRFDNSAQASGFVGTLKAIPDFIFDLESDPISSNAYSFNADYYEDSSNHMETIGRVKLDKYGLIKTMTGTFVRVGLANGCYSVGKLTGKRIN